MIKICGFLYIHPLTILLFVLGYITRQLEMITLCYSIMLIHETAHLIAALFIGLVPSKIVIYPFGLNLKLKNKMVYSLADEIILYGAGPLSNICMALACLFFTHKYHWATLIYMQNITLFILNMLPILPLDGGVIAKKIMASLWGYRVAGKVMKGISILFILLLSGLGIYLAIKNQFNYSVCFLIIFLIGNILTTQEKYNIDFIRELMFYKEKGRCFDHKKVKTMIMKEKDDYKKVACEFSTNSFYVVFCMNDTGHITNILTETEIMENITRHRG